MEQHVTWYMGGRIVYAEMIGETLTGPSLKKLDSALIPFLDQGESSDVHVILDLSAVKTIQPGVLESHLSYVDEAQLGWNVLIGPDALTHTLKPLLTPVNGDFCSFTSLEEGLFFLEDEDETLLMPI